MAKKERNDVMDTVVGLRDAGMTGRINNSALLALSEEALAHFWQARPQMEVEPDFRPTKFECRLYDALKPGDLVRFTVSVDKIGGKSAGFAIAVDCNRTRAADLEIIWTAVNPETAEPVALPEVLRDWLYQYLP
ncbi:acyl-CoA thioester hydrolase [Agrobacterium vitis]|nr:acyl-CoA thioester hydrolase [Agrobacterium vitis]MBE1438101.1 acyl-CoA thioester hydrolase [Agrobacterium vitis]